MHNFLKIVIALLLISCVTSSCTKQHVANEPKVVITKPGYQEVFFVPNIINVSYSVEHESAIEYIRVSIDNKDLTSVSDQYFYYPHSNSYEGDIDIPIDIIPNIIALPPYYVHIVVSDFSNINHTYFEIDLNNKQLEYKGCFLIGKHNINALSINYYNSTFDKEFAFEITGNYIDSDVYTDSKMIYIATTTPDKTRAFEWADGKLAWTKEPQLPYPEFNKITIDNSIVYLSTEIGRILGLSDMDGAQVFNTPVLRDSIPINICVTEDYVFSDYRFRNSGSKFWASFYKQTGSKYQIFPTGIETVDLYNLENANNIIAFCNEGLTGQIITFNVGSNAIESNIILNNIEITKSCKIDKNNFLFTSNKTIYHLNLQTNLTSIIAIADDTIVDMKFNNIYNQVNIAYPNKVEILSYPEFNSLKSIDIPYPIHGIELLYDY
ncbi:MAG: hypothetical protein QM503_02790 [Bacteroidota bacterium]